MRRAGFTLAEVVVALSLLAVVVAAVHHVLQSTYRAYRHQVEQMEITATLRAAAALLPGELRGLDPRDSMGGDLISIRPTSITYRPLRNLYFVCSVRSGQRSSVTLRAAYLGSRPLDPVVDSILIFAEGDPMTSDDDRWIHADLAWTWAGRCPGGVAGRSVGLRGVPPSVLAAISVGAPARSGAVMEMLRYRDRNGLWWLGMRRLRKSGRRPATQPVLGPLAPGGFEFRYLDGGGSPTGDPRQVASIGITVTAPPAHGDMDPYSEASIRRRRIDLRIALRNARQP